MEHDTGEGEDQKVERISGKRKTMHNGEIRTTKEEKRKDERERERG